MRLCSKSWKIWAQTASCFHIKNNWSDWRTLPNGPSPSWQSCIKNGLKGGLVWKGCHRGRCIAFTDRFPGQDALTLQRVVFEKKMELIEGTNDVPDVKALVQELIRNLFISTYNAQVGAAFISFPVWHLAVQLLAGAALPESRDTFSQEWTHLTCTLWSRKLCTALQGKQTFSVIGAAFVSFSHIAMHLLTAASLPASRGTFSLEWTCPSFTLWSRKLLAVLQHAQTLSFICAAFSSFSHIVMHLLMGGALPASRGLFSLEWICSSDHENCWLFYTA